MLCALLRERDTRPATHEAAGARWSPLRAPGRGFVRARALCLLESAWPLARHSETPLHPCAHQRHIEGLPVRSPFLLLVLARNQEKPLVSRRHSASLPPSAAQIPPPAPLVRRLSHHPPCTHPLPAARAHRAHRLLARQPIPPPHPSSTGLSPSPVSTTTGCTFLDPSRLFLPAARCPKLRDRRQTVAKRTALHR